MAEEKQEQLQPGEIEVVAIDHAYNVVVDGEKVQVSNLETALVLSKLEKIDQALQKKK